MKRCIFLFCMSVLGVMQAERSHYYATSADERHYSLVTRLIESILKVDEQQVAQIAVFDLGFTVQQREQLQSSAHVQVYDLEERHPDIKRHFRTSPQNRMVRGWFAWKPVAIKMALDMFPYVLYLDSGMIVRRSPEVLFKHIQQQGYFLVQSGHNICDRMTRAVIDRVIPLLEPEVQQLVLSSETISISAGIQGLSRDYYERYVKRVYELTNDLSLFADDGTALLGFGAGRHDQTLFSIFAHANRMTINPEGWMTLMVDGAVVPFHAHWNTRELQECSYLKY